MKSGTTPLIALVTDFGLGSPYVAEMKGVIYGILRTATIVDVSHAVRAQDIRQAALLLRDVRHAFPLETIFVVVVDPGVGSERAIVCVETASGRFIGPDNGVFTLISAEPAGAKSFEVSNSALWRDPVSATFHGRDIMAPVAAHLAAGRPIEEVGPPRKRLTTLAFPQPQLDGASIIGRIENADSFGNLISNIHASHLKTRSEWVVSCAERSLPMVRKYADRPSGDVAALIGSHGWLEIAVVNGNAEATLGIQRHDPITCHPLGIREGLGPDQ